MTERYVRADAAGGGNGTTDANSGANGAFTLAEAFADLNAPRAGYRYNVKTGAYSTAGVTLTGDGTPANPNIFEGFKDSPGDLRNQQRTNGVDAWDTADWPVITFDQATRLDSTGADLLIWSRIKFASAGTGFSGPLLYTSATNVFLGIVVTNPSTNANASGIYGGTLAYDCDVILTGSSGGLYGISTCTRTMLCRIDLSTSNAGVVGIRLGLNGLSLFNNFVQCGGFAHDGISTTANQAYTVIGATVPAGVNCVRVGNVAHTNVNAFIGNLIANVAGYAFDSQYVATADLAAVFIRNRLRDLTSGVQRGFSNWYDVTVWGEITSDDTDANEFVNLGGKDTRIRYGSKARGMAGAGALDAGACQRTAQTVGYIIGS